MAITKTQSRQVASSSGTISATATGHCMASNSAAGSLLVLVARSDATWSSGGSGAPTIPTPTTAGFTWSVGPSGTYSDVAGQQSGRVSIFYIANAGAMASSLNTSIAVSRAGSDSLSISFTAYEFAGVAVSPTDVNASLSSQTSSPISAGSLSTAGTALILAACIAEASVSTGSGFTAGPNTSEQYILNQASGSISTAFGANTGSDKWGAAAIDFLAVAVSSTTLCQTSTFGF